MSTNDVAVNDLNCLHLMAELRRLDLLLRRRALLRQQRPGRQSLDDDLLGLYISDDEAHRIMANDLLAGDDFDDGANSASDVTAERLATLEAERAALAKKARSLANRTTLRL